MWGNEWRRAGVEDDERGEGGISKGGGGVSYLVGYEIQSEGDLRVQLRNEDTLGWETDEGDEYCIESWYRCN